MGDAVDLDFSGDVKAASGFETLPEGTYNARIDEIEVRETKPKEGEEQIASDGTPARYFSVKYKIMGGDYDGRFVWGINSVRFPKTALDDTKKERQTREIFLSWLNLVTGTDFAGSGQSLNTDNLVGAGVRLVITVRTYEGEPQNNVKRVLSPKKDGEVSTSASKTL